MPRKWWALALLVLLLDQASKQLVVASFRYGELLPVLPSFNLVYVLNPGAAFSFLADSGGWQRYFFLALALIISALLVRQVKARPQAFWLGLGAALVIGGALGNAIDRVLIGAVVDFLDLYWGVHHWPAFNLADMAISAGVVAILIHEFRPGQRQPEQPSPPTDQA